MNSSSNFLMRKGKRSAAMFVQAECSKSAETNQFKELLAVLLNPLKSIEDTEVVDWIKWLIAGGKTPTEFSNLVRSYDNGTTCGLVWTANFVAYRCRTCGISPCMSLCAECFQRGNHDGHDFNMFRSQAGGACDCGDSSVMKEAGFCDRHGPHAQLGKPILPPNLLVVAQVAMPHILLRLILHLRSNSIPDELETQLQAVNSADSFIQMLHDFSGMGAAMREVITSTLLNTQLYSQLLETVPSDPEVGFFMCRARQMYTRTLENLKGPEPPEECRGFPALQDILEHHTFLEELVFWTVKFEFPQKMVCLLLNMLPDPVYKEAFTRAFVLHYARISRLLVGSADPDTLSNRVVHVSVQLFSNEELAMKMVDELHLLHVMVISLKDMMSKILIPSTLQDPKKNFHFVVDCSKHVMKDHCYWPLVSDLSNLLSHRPVALKFLSDSGLLRMWFAFLSMFQGMNVNKREMGSHVDFEPNTYYAAFSAELEAPASAMWALAIHLRDPSTIPLTRMLLSHCQRALEGWLLAISLHGVEQNDAYQVSFHIPLHRYLAAFTSQAVRSQGISLNEILPPNHLLQLIMVHPLRIQAAFYEILSGLWVRNGLQIKGQAMSYIQCHFGNSMVDADLYLLQLCAMQLSPDMLLPLIFERFHVLGYLSLRNGNKSHFLEGEQETAMLESCLIFLSSLMVLRTNIGANESELDRLEIVSLLCMGDRTHSQLMELLPEKCGAPQNKDFDAILTQVADYKAPNFEASGSMQQGMYVPKALVWEELYDPIYVLLRAVHRRDFQTSLDRFTQYVRQSGKHPNLATGTLWPPFRLPIAIHRGYEDPRKALASKTFHAIVFVLLYKAVYVPSRINEQTLALVVYLLDLAVSFCLEQPSAQAKELSIANVMPKRSEDYIDLDFSRWFHGDALHENVCTVINNIVFASPQAVVLSTTDAAELEVDSSSSSSSSSSGSEAAYQAMDLDSPDSGLREGTLAIANEPTSRPNGSASSSGNLTGTSSASNQAELALAHPASEFHSAGTSTDLQLFPASYLGEARGNEIAKYFKDKRDSSSASIPGGAQVERVTVRESIVSLLLRLYSTFGGQLESYQVPEMLSGEGDAEGCAFNGAEDGRIGDGRFWIRKVLDKLCSLHPNVLHSVKSTVQALNEARNTKAICFSGSEDLTESEKKRRIKERQQRLLQEFANKQREFMQHAMAAEQMETDFESVPGDSKTPSPNQESGQLSYTSTPEAPKELQRAVVAPTYDCVICNQSSPSTMDRPMCLVILLQSTNMLQKPSPAKEALHLPVNSDQMSEFLRHQRISSKEERQRLDVLEKFSNAFSFMESKDGGRVFVQTCGHCLHLDCQKQYLQALRTQQRHQTMDVEHGEYACPLCRQLANSALPIVGGVFTNGPVPLSSPEPGLAESASEIMEILARHNPVVSPSGLTLTNAIGEIVEDMINISVAYRKPNESSSSPRSLPVFLRTTARANIELELMQRNESLSQGPFNEQAPSEHRAEMNPSENSSHLFDEGSQSFSKDGYQEQSGSSKFGSKGSAYSWPLLPKRSCLSSLLHVLASQRKALTIKPLGDIWKKVTGQDCGMLHGRALLEKNRGEEEREAPLLTLDPISLLVELTLCLPLPIQKHQFRCLAQHLYNVLVTQIIILRSQAMSNDKKKFYKENCICDWPLSALVSCVIRKLDASLLEVDEVRNSDSYSSKKSSCKADFENSLHERAISFLRVAAVLQHYFLGNSLPSVSSNASMRNEFEALCSCLDLSWKPTLSGEKDFTCLVENWFNELKFVSGTSKEVCEVIALYHRRFFTPRLLILPRAYDAIFQFYHRATCERCMQIPKEPSVCLSCGTMVCLRESCCKSDNIHEAVQHSIDCGVGTAVFLAINSSTIIVIRGKRACLWGSVYLDVFGEEDRELKRGKPLYLSNERYELLERQWLSHRFDHTNKKWIWHRDAL